MKLYHDGAEHNSLNPLSSTTTSGSGSVSASSSNPASGSHHFRCSTDGSASDTAFFNRHGGLTVGPPLHYPIGTNQDYIPQNKNGYVEISFMFSVSRAPSGTIDNHNIFIAHIGSSDLVVRLLKSGSSWIVQYAHVGTVLPSFNPVAGTYYRFHIRIERWENEQELDAGSFDLEVYTAASTTLLSRLSGAIGASTTGAAFTDISFGRSGGFTLGSPGAISFDFDDISINDQQDPNGNGIHTGDPGAVQTKNANHGTPTADGSITEWNNDQAGGMTNPNNFDQVNDGSDSTYVDTDLGADLPRRDAYTMGDVDDDSGNDTPTAMTVMARGGPDAGSTPIFHSVGIHDGTAVHYVAPTWNSAGLRWVLVVIGEKRGGGALDKTYIDGSEYYIEKTSNVLNLNDLKITQLEHWVEDDNNIAAVDYSGYWYEKSQTQGD